MINGGDTTKTLIDLNAVRQVQADAPASELLDLAAIRLPQGFEAGGVKAAITLLQVRRPDRQWFVRVHSGHDYQITVATLDYERAVYLLHPTIAAALPGECRQTAIYLAITRQGVPFLWPINLSYDRAGTLNPWAVSSLQAARHAMTKWTRLASNQQLGAYEIFTAEADLDDPEFPDKSFQELLSLGFRDRYITSTDHIIIQRLHGRA